MIHKFETVTENGKTLIESSLGFLFDKGTNSRAEMKYITKERILSKQIHSSTGYSLLCVVCNSTIRKGIQ